MNRVSLRVQYVGAAPACYGKAGWVHRPVNVAGQAWTFQADDGTQKPCNVQDVTPWWPGATKAA